MGTKSNRSAGSQFTPNGPVQGTVLVDPATGEPISTTGGKLDTTAAFSGTLEVHLTADNDSVAIADPANLAHVLKPNADGSINADVILSSSTDSIRADQGNPGLPANAWPVKPTDGTNSQSYTASGEAKVTGSVTANPPVSNTPAVSRITAAASDTTLLASNANRKGAIFFNESTAIAYLKLGTSSSATSYTIQMGANSSFIIDGNPIYTGQVNATWASATGFMQVTELT